MLALCALRCFSHSTLHLQTRSLRTLPRKIPTYVARWDPTIQKPVRLPTALTEAKTATAATLQDSTKPTTSEQLIYAQKPSIPLEAGYVGQRYAVKRLNYLLQMANSSSGRDAKLRAPVWRAYRLAKAIDPKLLAHLPERAWSILWNTQSIQSPINGSRRMRLEQLYRDMDKAGQAPTVGQRAKYLESVFLSGRVDFAIREWEQDNTAELNGARQDYRPEHLEIGAKLYALAGCVDRSRDIMDDLFRLYPGWDTSVMMAVFRAHTSSENREHHDYAKQIYARMKEQKGAHCTIEDYDAWLVGFLEARNLTYAKQVFRDMVKEGHLVANETDGRVHQVLKRLHLLYRLGTDIAKMTSIALDAISVLPPVYYGHLFGDWMKSAVVKKAPEAAAQILDMMLNRGYQPETYHFNMLLKALIRTKEEPNILKAENIGWRMIDEARKANERRVPGDTTTETIGDTSISAQDASASLPAANVTTFALIMQHHAKSLQWEHVEYLTRQLQESRIAPNATIMNVLIDNKCRQGAYTSAWAIYKTLTNPATQNSAGVFPNGATLRCLWKTLRLALGDHATRNDPGLPTPRDLLKETVAWWTLSRSRFDADRFRMGFAGADNGAITALIMHCFSYTSDLAGSLVALHVLRHKFNIFPTDKAARILQRQMAWVDLARESETVRSQYFHSRSNARNSQRVVSIYNILLQRRLEGMRLSDKEYEGLTDEQIGDVGLDLLSEFVRVVLKRRYPPEVVEAMIDAARCAVGVPDLPTGDMDAFEVV